MLEDIPIAAVTQRIRLRMARLWTTIRYRRALARGAPAGSRSYRLADSPWPDRLPVVVFVRGEAGRGATEDAARAWRRHQTLEELVVVGCGEQGTPAWTVGPDTMVARTGSETWFAAPGDLPDLIPSHMESCLLVAAAEAVDAVLLHHEAAEGPAPVLSVDSVAQVCDSPLRCRTLYRADAFVWDAARDLVVPRKEDLLIKIIDSRGDAGVPDTGDFNNQLRRGPYLSTKALGPALTVALNDASQVQRQTRSGALPGLLVLAPFLARGGAEQTLFGVMDELRERIDFSIATLAPHRLHLGDRRPDFRTITPRIYCPGDLVHPDAMMGILLQLIDALGITIIYNANGTTLFYDFAPRLKAERPGLRIVDHLYDHRVGYVERYGPSLMSSVDACVAENHAIARELVENRGWPAERVPVIWPCGRPESELPAEPDRGAIRHRVREELGFTDDDVVLLTAARMHEQKRPLDLVALAERVRDLDSVRFLIVGGGDLEGEVDAAIGASRGARIHRLPFRDDIPDLILAADVGVLVSDFEGLPVFLLECLQLGRPFLGTRVGDLGTVIDETGAGLVVERPGNLDALETAVRRLAVPEIRASAARRALEAAPRFGVASCARAYERVLLGED